MLIGQPKRVAIIGGNRIPFARSNTVYLNVSNQMLLTAALAGLVSRFDLEGEKIGEVVAGAVLKHPDEANLTRESLLSTKLDPETPAYDIQQACGTGLEAAVLVANKIALGQIDCGIAGGVDSTSDAPIMANRGLRKVLMRANAAKTGGDRFKAMLGLRPSHIVPELPALAEPRTGLSMGEHMQITANEWNVSREAQDQLALNSHANMSRAYEKGFFDDLMTPFMGLESDNNLRPDSDLEKLSKLKPAFAKNGQQGTLTAGNSTPLTDGASVVLLASEEWAKERGLDVLAYLTLAEVASVDFVDKKEGLLMAPSYALPRLLKKANLTLKDFDFFEFHEAFAAQVLCTIAAINDEKFCRERVGLEPLGEIDYSKLNVNGSSIAAGHPFAATGGRIVASLAKMLAQKGSGRGLISICAAGGQGITAIVER